MGVWAKWRCYECGTKFTAETGPGCKPLACPNCPIPTTLNQTKRLKRNA